MAQPEQGPRQRSRIRLRHKIDRPLALGLGGDRLKGGKSAPGLLLPACDLGDIDPPRETFQQPAQELGKKIEDRFEALTASNQAREQEMTLRIGFDKDAKLIASHGDYSSNNGAYPQGADCNIAVHMFMWPAHKMPAYGFLTRGWYSNTNGLGAYRGPWAMESLVRETAFDKAARQIALTGEVDKELLEDAVAEIGVKEI